jgi:hypothetical protein
MKHALVKWRITKGHEDEFIAYWKGLAVPKGKGLFREILTQAEDSSPSDKLHTWDFTDLSWSTFVNVGIWHSAEEFEEAVGKWIGKNKDFEAQIRERKILKFVVDRGGMLPEAALDA